MAASYTSATLTSATQTTAYPVNFHSALPTTWAVSAGVGTYSVEGTLDNIFDPTVTPVWFALPSGSGLTSSSLNVYLGPLKAIRLNVTAYTSGNFILKVLFGSPAIS